MSRLQQLQRNKQTKKNEDKRRFGIYFFKIMGKEVALEHKEQWQR